MSSDSEDYSDEDYNPDKEVSEAGSEIESDDDVGDDQPDDESASKPKVKAPTAKRKAKSGSTKSTRNKRSKAAEEEDVTVSPEKEEASVPEDDEEAEKKRAAALWADFLGGDAPAEEPKEERPRAQSTKVVEDKKPAPEPVPEKKKEPTVIKEIFEYAGEQIVVEKVVKEPPVVQKGSSKSPFPTSKPSSSSGGGLGSILGALNKKNKISTLDKTKLDWDRFKNQEGITEDLQTHNKGKDGYLERQDFLQRTDVRQFELERTMRQTSRSNR